MPDVLTKAQRSYNMSRIRRSNTRPELKIRKVMKVLGFTYQPKGIFGNPDFVNKREKIAVFVDGCFWHGCPVHYKPPEGNREFWERKIRANAERDLKVTEELRKKGYIVIRVWEHDLRGI